jgi:gluconolactonase
MRLSLLIALIVITQAHGGDNGIFAPDAKLKVEAAGGSGGEGPAWDPKLGLLTSGGGHIYQLDRKGQSRIYRKNAGTNGLLFDAKGRLLACEPALRRVTRTERDGTITVLTDRYQGKRYNQPNDITVDSQGRIYFSDPRYGNPKGMELFDAAGKNIEGIYRIDPDGKVTRVTGRELERPNGVLVSADDRYLFVADNNNDTAGGARKLWRFQLRKDGSVDVASRKLLHDWDKGRGPTASSRIRRAGSMSPPGSTSPARRSSRPRTKKAASTSSVLKGSCSRFCPCRPMKSPIARSAAPTSAPCISRPEALSIASGR